MMTDNDSPLKELLEQELLLALAFFFPDIHAGLDWGQDHEILEQELWTLYPTGETGKRIADCLVKAVGVGGDARCLHGEVQGGVEEGFPRRMHVYNYRAEDRFGQPVRGLEEVSGRTELGATAVSASKTMRRFSPHSKERCGLRRESPLCFQGARKDPKTSPLDGCETTSQPSPGRRSPSAGATNNSSQ